ncbi:hypothetical protein C7S15_8428 [Burkholderia cepacia]|nr:hypothetical protein [Burkholderia cepacia]
MSGCEENGERRVEPGSVSSSSGVVSSRAVRKRQTDIP